MISQIPITNSKEACHIFTDVKRDMISQGIDQWDEVYPNEKIIETDILNNHAFGYCADGVLMGYIAINEYFDKEYNDLDWKHPDNRPLIVHRLAVHSKFQGLGIAKALMLFAEDKAINEGYATIRLDAFSKNPKALKFYDNLDYQFVGEVTFRKGVFYCFEKSMQ